MLIWQDFLIRYSIFVICYDHIDVGTESVLVPLPFSHLGLLNGRCLIVIFRFARRVERRLVFIQQLRSNLNKRGNVV